MRKAQVWLAALGGLVGTATNAGAQPVEGPPAEPPPGPGGAHYTEPPAGPPQSAPPPYPAVYEPPPPLAIYEPPPPPRPRHVAPKTALSLGARLGWFVPFGNLWVVGSPSGVVVDEVKWSEFASAGPMFELDGGARLGRYYTVFLLWEHAVLGTGSREIPALGKQERSESDYYALGLRFSSDPNTVGFLTEINLGFRRFRSIWDSGAELRMTEAPLEFRIGFGADIRLGPAFSLSPMVTLGAGSFGDAEWLNPDGSTSSATAPGDGAAGHGWLTLHLGGHFDLFGSQN
ncbi:MAG: hypothetical protein KF718_30095 [Polyangiaceae bacterium]|nr:hypothetical protein [Polyangiaceae bacterium]